MKEVTVYETTAKQVMVEDIDKCVVMYTMRKDMLQVENAAEFILCEPDKVKCPIHKYTGQDREMYVAIMPETRYILDMHHDFGYYAQQQIDKLEERIRTMKGWTVWERIKRGISGYE